MESLVNLRAIDVVAKLAKDGYFEIGSYGKPIACVIPVVETREELVKLFRTLEQVLNEREKNC